MKRKKIKTKNYPELSLIRKAVIADGNRRFAKQRKLNQQSGYGQGFKKGLKVRIQFD